MRVINKRFNIETSYS